MTIKTTGIVLKVQDYKENDGLAWMLTKNQIVSVRVRGIQKEGSKLRSGCQPFLYATWQIEERNQGPGLLIHATPICFFYRVMEDLTIQAFSFLLRDILLKTKSSPLLLEAFLEYLKAVQDQRNSVFAYGCFVLKEILCAEGIQPFVDGCTLCHRKDALETLSIKEGGFLCHYCNQNGIKMNKADMRKVYLLFKASLKHIDVLIENCHFEIKDCIFWADWYERFEQTHLAGLKFLKTVVDL
ncbi:MAG: DNA repair protein RecO [Faecalicoccus sp.]|uniref:DNA repair protein RecO n=1 Tax=unclassified Faecalicoccus TaxID=2643311 RepID=UPI0025D9B301|nr:DNA repair protein RecO [Faecalicoccus sp.]MCI6380086.1 DNA repair protein RecO [Erysipelotrichaceae bacterium]MDY4870571.1 DNA repair protein RecO [Faecalicoccus sp.]